MIIYLLLSIALAAAAATLLRLRVKVVLSRKQQTLFVGLGRSGREYDFASRMSHLRLFGFNIWKLAPGKREKTEAEAKPKPVKKPKAKKSRRHRSISDFAMLLPASSRAVGKYFLSLLKAVILEELDGEIKGGFDRPDLTGQVYGFYQAALAVVPAASGRFRFAPDWDGRSIAGSARISLAIPLYRILAGTVVLFFRLPLRDITKLAIGRKKGDEDVQ